MTGSSDHTAEVAALAGAKVLRTGFAAADWANVIVTIDTGGEHSLTDVSSTSCP